MPDNYLIRCLIGMALALPLAGAQAQLIVFVPKTIPYISAAAVTTWAGTAGNKGSADGSGIAAQFAYPMGVAVATNGMVYVADDGNQTIRRITPLGEVTTLAGMAGSKGHTDGLGAVARFCGPVGVAVDANGNVYVADAENHTIRKITAAGEVTTMAGVVGSKGSVDGIGPAARFNLPHSVAVDESGNLYVADTFNHTIRKLTPAGSVTTLAGVAGRKGSADGSGVAARFFHPSAVAVDKSGNVYVADNGNHTIRKVTAAGMVTTLAGAAGHHGNTDSTGTAARFFFPSSVAVDGSGNVYVADHLNDTIRKITAAGKVTTLAGTVMYTGQADGVGAEARFSEPFGVAVDAGGTLYVTDSGNNIIRVIK